MGAAGNIKAIVDNKVAKYNDKGVCIPASASGDTKRRTGIDDTRYGNDSMDGNGGRSANATVMAKQLNVEKPVGILAPADTDGNNDARYGNEAAHDDNEHDNDGQRVTSSVAIEQMSAQLGQRRQRKAGGNAGATRVTTPMQ
jgi:hypothetical protein